MGAKLTGRNKTRRSHAMMSEINVTPFVDVMLVLLVIFMITAPMLTAGVSVDLPKANAKAVSEQDNAPLEVALDTKGNIFVGENKVSMERMREMLSVIAQEAPDRRIYIKADKGLDYGRVMDVMAAVNQSGFTKIALITDPSSRR